MAAIEKKKFRIAGLGEALWDVYDANKFIGGSPTNFTIHIAAAGHEAFLCSRVGNDAGGSELLKKLRDRRVNTDGVQTDIFRPTGNVRIAIDAAGAPTYFCTGDCAFDDMRMDSVWEDLAPKMDAVFFGQLAQRGDTSREAIQAFLAAAPNAVKVCDLNLRRWDAKTEQIVVDSLASADIIKLNRAECELLKTGLGAADSNIVFLRQLVNDYNLKMAALTLGQHGCYLITPNSQEFDPGYYISPIDTSGAGDAFVAALVVKFLEEAPLPQIADFANRLAAYVSLQQGATPCWSLDELSETMVIKL